MLMMFSFRHLPHTAYIRKTFRQPGKSKEFPQNNTHTILINSLKKKLKNSRKTNKQNGGVVVTMA